MLKGGQGEDGVAQARKKKRTRRESADLHGRAPLFEEMKEKGEAQWRKYKTQDTKHTDTHTHMRANARTASLH